MKDAQSSYQKLTIDSSSTDESERYEIPDNAKKVYIIRSAVRLNDFDTSSRIYPSADHKDDELESLANRRSGSDVTTSDLPPPKEEKLTPNLIVKDDDVSICEINL